MDTISIHKINQIGQLDSCAEILAESFNPAFGDEWGADPKQDGRAGTGEW